MMNTKAVESGSHVIRDGVFIPESVKPGHFTQIATLTLMKKMMEKTIRATTQTIYQYPLDQDTV